MVWDGFCPEWKDEIKATRNVNALLNCKAPEKVCEVCGKEIGELEGCYLVYTKGNRKYRNQQLLVDSEVKPSPWTKLSDKLPPLETPLLIKKVSGDHVAGAMDIEHPSFEESFKPYNYFSDEEGCEIEWEDIEYWMVIPKLEGE